MKAAHTLIKHGAEASQKAMEVLLRDLISEDVEIEAEKETQSVKQQDNSSLVKAIHENDIKKAKELITINKYRFAHNDAASARLVDLALSLGRLEIAVELIEHGAQFTKENMLTLLESVNAAEQE